MKDQDLHNLPASPAQAAEQVTSSSALGQQCCSDFKRKDDSPNVSFMENCEDPASWLESVSTAQREFLIAKGPHKLDLNYEFPKDVGNRKFFNCYVQRKLSNGETMQRKWANGRCTQLEKSDILLALQAFSH